MSNPFGRDAESSERSAALGVASLVLFVLVRQIVSIMHGVK